MSTMKSGQGMTVSIEAAIDTLINRVGNEIVLALPLGIGKPNPFVNALYRRVKASPVLQLKIFTALSFEKPRGHSDLEKRFLEPFVARVFGDYPDLEYVCDARSGSLPANVEIHEFFMKTGDYLGNTVAQQHVIYCNYSHVARDLLAHGVNVLAQAIAVEAGDGGVRYSLSSNPDVTLDLLDLSHAPGEPARKPIFTIGVINRRMPFMPNDAEVPAALFDLLVDDPAAEHDLFAPPNMKVDSQDYAISLWASTLVRDGGTLQIGIGSLGDGVAQALILRRRQNAGYRDIIAALGSDAQVNSRDLDALDKGLYGCSEMFVNGFLWLIEAGIVRREVFYDVVLQRLVNEGKINGEVVPATLLALHDAGKISSPLTANDAAWLTQFGILREGVTWRDGNLVAGAKSHAATLKEGAAFDALCQDCLGSHLRGGVFLHGGFFLGPRRFYQALRDMPHERRSRINMSRISYINELLGHEELAALQRINARFINTTMMVTLLGAAVSDGLDDGQLVSGVGGQYNFVAMGHALPDARSILLVRATRSKGGEVASNVVWNYGHTTIPRHLRDIVISEYGIADLRGQSDGEVIKRMLSIADSRFQADLLADAKANGKLDADWEIPESQRNNFPARIDAALTSSRALLPDFPLGTDFSEDELVIVDALTRLKQSSEHPLELAKMALDGAMARLFDNADAPARYLDRMKLQDVHGVKERLLRALFLGNL
ncbi:MAG: acetyl-CoA hydrolase/transferase C-terminal domain-containing protein [Betaproteobacteria bacterium]